MENRIWTDGEGLSWSTITELLGQDEETPQRLRNLTLDLSDYLLALKEQLDRAREAVRKQEEEIAFVRANIGSCILFADKRLGYGRKLSYLHDKKRVLVSIDANEATTNSEIIVEHIPFIEPQVLP